MTPQAVSVAPIWRIRMLGPLRLSGDLGVTERFPTRKVASLIAYLAYHADRVHSRDRLADLFWPDAPGDLARQSLRTALWAVRRQVEPVHGLAGTVLEADRDSVHLRRGAVETDVGAFGSALRYASGRHAPGELHWLQRATSLYDGDLLPGLDDDWVAHERERLGSACAGALLRGAQLCEERGEIEEALEWVRRAVERDPLSEEGHVMIVRLHLAAGRRVEAARHAREAGRLWRLELGLEPSRAVNALLEGHGPVTTPSGRSQPHAEVERVRPSPDPVLPDHLTRMYGRDGDVARLTELLRPAQAPAARLVTITGVGGCGKTRLAVAVAAALADAYAGAVAFVPLEGARTPDDFVTCIGMSVRAEPGSGAQAFEALVERLRTWPSGDSRWALLVLDGFDDAADTARATLRDLLARTPRLACIVTARRSLGIPGEHVARLEHLAVPGASEDCNTVRASAAVMMLFDRIRTRRPSLSLDDTTARDLADLARIVDGSPLGLELLAGWAGVMDLAEMKARLTDPLRIAARPGEGRPERHASLAAVFERTWEALGSEPRKALTRLAAFPGDWDLAAAESVCGASAIEALDVMTDRSLVVEAGRAGSGRYRLLHPVREFVRARVQMDEPYRRHAAHYARLAAEVGDRWSGVEADSVVTALADEMPNIERALDVCFAEGAPEPLRAEGVRAAAALAPYWERTGRFAEGRDVLRVAEGFAARLGPEESARVLLGLGILAGASGEYAEAGTALARSLDHWRQSGDLEGEAATLVELGSRAWDLGDIAGASDRFAAAYSLSSGAGRIWGAVGLAKVAAHDDMLDRAAALQSEALDLARSGASRRVVAAVLQEMGVTEWFSARPDRARPLLIESLATFRRLGDRYSQMRSLWGLGNVALANGRIETARAYFADAAEIATEGGHPVRIAYCLEAFAAVAEALGDGDQAARLLGAALRLREDIRYGLRIPAEHRLYVRLTDAVRARLGPEAFETALCEAKAMPWREAMACALHG